MARVMLNDATAADNDVCIVAVDPEQRVAIPTAQDFMADQSLSMMVWGWVMPFYETTEGAMSI